MKHRHINDVGFTLPAIDNIIERGELPDWAPILDEIEKEPFGEIAEKTLKICQNHVVYGGTAVFLAFIEEQRKKAKAAEDLANLNKMRSAIKGIEP